jgi:hypothetical protein
MMRKNQNAVLTYAQHTLELKLEDFFKSLPYSVSGTSVIGECGIEIDASFPDCIDCYNTNCKRYGLDKYGNVCNWRS